MYLGHLKVLGLVGMIRVYICLFNSHRRAGIFTREEVIEQAIDRWSTYIRLCGKAMTFLRETMVENYVREVVEAKAQSNLSGPMEAPSAGKITPPGDLSTDSKHSTLVGEYSVYFLYALSRPGIKLLLEVLTTSALL